MTYSLSMASMSDTLLSPLTRELNERQKQQILISKNQLLQRMPDPVEATASQRQNNNVERDRSRFAFLSMLSQSPRLSNNI